MAWLAESHDGKSYSLQQFHAEGVGNLLDSVCYLGTSTRYMHLIQREFESLMISL